MINIETFAREQLNNSKLTPAERKAVEGIVLMTEGWNLNHPQTTKQLTVPKQFTPEARQKLEKDDYLIYSLTGQSIRSLREAERQFRSTWHQDYPDFEELTSRQSEVAVNPNKLFLVDSNNKTLEQQIKLIDKFSKQLRGRGRIANVEVVLGEAADYCELVFLHLDITGERLFGEKYQYNYTRTKTCVSSAIAYVGGFRSGDGLDVGHWDPDCGDGSGWAAPLVVPA